MDSDSHKSALWGTSMEDADPDPGGRRFNLPKMHQNSAENLIKFKIYRYITKTNSTSVVDVDPDPEPDPYWIRIQELCGSGSVFKIRIRIHTCQNKLKWRKKV